MAGYGGGGRPGEAIGDPLNDKFMKGQQGEEKFDALVINEVQLILAEKRTSMSVMRTGIAIFALPLSVLSVLVATSKYYHIDHVWHLLVPLMFINLGLIALGVYLIVHSIQRLKRYDKIITALKRKHSVLAELLD